MKRLLAFCLLLSLLASPCHAADIFVSVTGSDSAPGTASQPLASLQAAVRKARELRRLHDPSIQSGIHIILSGGTYFLQETIRLRAEDSGTPDSPTVIEAAPGAQPVISGGFPITGWHRCTVNPNRFPATAKDRLWCADVLSPAGSMPLFRQLWINGVKGIHARNTDETDMQRILSWDKKTKTCVIPVSGTLHYQPGMELFIHQWWEIAMLRIKKIQQQGDSARLWFFEPESSIQSEHPWPAPWISAETGNSAFYLNNAAAFLDKPGEWWFDAAAQKIYYWPRANEDMRKATIVAPLLENLLVIAGTPAQPVTNIQIKGIAFEYSNWLRPSQAGHVPHQAGMFMTEAYPLSPAGTPGKAGLENQAWVGRPSAALTVCCANHTSITGCRFEHLASTGVDYAKFTHHNTIEGCLFNDIGGTALLAGIFSAENTEVHIPYQPADTSETCSHTLIRNNLINDAANEDWGCVGIGLGYTANTRVLHNEINNVSYTGISDGWGWTASANAMHDNLVSANKVTHYGKHNYDCAAIYTLSNQPGTIISENYIDSIYVARYAHLPAHWFYLYTDEGSSNITVTNNWCPSEKFLQNANGPGNNWNNNGPQVNPRVKSEAGLEPAFQYLAAYKTVDGTLKINSEQPVLLEMVFNEGALPELAKLKESLREIPSRQIQLSHWKNHYLIFGYVNDLRLSRQRLSKDFPSAKVTVYDNIYYHFDRSYCKDTATARAWTDVILSASLVDDTRLQQAYLHDHAIQFEKWPGVARGFCAAGFQRLLGYKNGKRLMLVISIPKGESLDKLNPETTRNNPQMREWNARMKKYQQGIEGTKPGETWVFFTSLE